MKQVKSLLKKISLILAISCVMLFHFNVGNANADVSRGSWVDFNYNFYTIDVYSTSNTISFHSFCESKAPYTLTVKPIAWKNGNPIIGRAKSLDCGYWGAGKFGHLYFPATKGYLYEFKVEQNAKYGAYTGVNYEIHH
ncbi:hypothetical protein COL60_13690 [Bacillus pseudomycoides]|uniref:hypothetical protein n=1 Tax=Bacillus pseudomycoides TaxID=64104 RepID=UPI000BF3E1AB|nr:hypothetical protein [Bacillus pseudomycoides]PFZ09335.1 hypothetical protein COL60_13690 [Bacillus pseudomycoides]PGC25980.1 hypothetical protein COM11_22485 [Bacillus pseudomycoides]